MFKTITASEIRKKVSLAPPPEGKRCFIIIDDHRIQMVYEILKGRIPGLRYYFICPYTNKRCRKLQLAQGRYIHASAIKGYYRISKPAWFNDSPFTQILIRKQKQIDAEKCIESKAFKTHYNGQPTKRYLKCVSDIKVGKKYSMDGILNGKYI